MVNFGRKCLTYQQRHFCTCNLPGLAVLELGTRAKVFGLGLNHHIIIMVDSFLKRSCVQVAEIFDSNIRDSLTLGSIESFKF